jgi:hypothetical protein
MNYLLRPNAATRALFEEEFKIMEREDVLKIGIQMRFGDNHMAAPGQYDTLESVMAASERFFMVSGASVAPLHDWCFCNSQQSPALPSVKWRLC